MAAKILAAGDRGVLIRMRGAALATLIARSDAARGEAAVTAAIPADDSILLLFAPGTTRDAQFAVAEHVARAPARRGHSSRTRHFIEVSFAEEHAPDLPRLLEAADLDRAGFFDAVAALTLRVRFLGFRPGFAYLAGVPEPWQLPRLATPRAHVPAGSFAVAGARAGFYADESPGGWNVIGRTDAALWDRGRSRPNLLAPGDEVKIVPSDRALEPPAAAARAEPREAIALEVVNPGSATHLVDAADVSRVEWGLPPGGPFDAEAAAVANRNAGNPDDAPLLECALSGPCFRAVGRASVAWAGARAAIRINGRDAGDPRRVDLEPGDELEIGGFERGARGYLALAGGFAPPHPRDLAPRLGRGSVLAAGSLPRMPSHFRVFDRGPAREVEAILGPDRVRRSWRDAIRNSEWRVTARSDRAGVRLTSGVTIGGIAASLPSTGMQPGTVQWHPDGDLVVMGPDHPVTGGYLQVMTLRAAELWKIAQLRPGDAIRWRVADP